MLRSQLGCSDSWLANVAQNLNAELGACWYVLIQDWILSAAPLPMFLNIEINVDLLRIVLAGAARLALLLALLRRMRELSWHAAGDSIEWKLGSRAGGPFYGPAKVNQLNSIAKRTKTNCYNYKHNSLLAIILTAPGGAPPQ